ncbi:ferrous iron transport protein B [Methanotorris igneus]|uniref:Ferrous iron transport protein B n=1 Tax=Methanotorris igneus (strain DSM 5666 / JCM 11834 / Kol 5) TaxID=880724 RepID=F6BEY0_METIK|nr:ferrous iron transport protein B [Methanotorris igneus]AEF95716.1 ferrous iron transport protein B [Methanotorris igneus Kol 5]
MSNNHKKIVALVGQPNVGKSTIFNELTGSNQSIGNWPGVTVEKKEGILKYKDKEYVVVDLPGIYSLMSNSIDQKIARDFLIENEDAIILNIIDTPNINRNLYLTLQLIEMGKSPILCLNLIDEAERFGVFVDEEKLSKKLNLPVIKTSGRHKIGIKELKEAIYNYKPRKPNVIKYSPILEECIEKIIEKLDNLPESDKFAKLPKRWIAISLLEGDPEVLEAFKDNEEFMNYVAKLKEKIESKIKHDIESYIVEERYRVCDELLKDIIISTEIHDDIDVIVVHPIYGTIIFACIMYLMYNFVFSVGGVFSEIIAEFFGFIGGVLSNILPPLYKGFIVDGLLAGVGSVLEFYPQIVLIMFSLSILEDCGYLARVAALMHSIMSKFGLSGKSFIPIILSFGCNVPGIMATRIIESPRDRLLTVLVAPLVPCSARFVVIGFLAGAFFASYKALFTLLIILTTMGLMLLVSSLLGRILFKRETEPFIFELPPYRTPDWRNVLKMTWERSKEFLIKAGTIIALGSLIFYYIFNYPTIEDSYAMVVGKILEHITLLMGLDWRGAIALVFGIFAKELVVSTLSIVYGDVTKYITPLQAFVLCLVSVIYIPCLATIAAIYTETKSIKWTLFGTSYNLILATTIGIIVYQLGKLLGF